MQTINSNTQNDLTVCKQMSSGSFKNNVTYKLTSHTCMCINMILTQSAEPAEQLHLCRKVRLCQSVLVYVIKKSDSEAPVMQ